MKHITTGHWIFAGLFAIAFVVFLFWSYRKDKPMHQIHYKGRFTMTLVLILIFFLLFVFKRLF
jgi:cytochrome bd-type quinol oxidase subunit 1